MSSSTRVWWTLASTRVPCSVCSVVTVQVCIFVPISDTAMLFLGFPLGFFAPGVYSPIGAFLNDLSRSP